MTAAKQKEVVILHVAGEGGGYTILGEQHQGHWRFWCEPGGGDSWMYEDDDIEAITTPATKEPTPEPDIEYCDTLDEVLKQFNSCWPLLHPIEVHPSFASDILKRVTSYMANNSDRSRSGVTPRWQQMCQIDESGVAAVNLPGR